MLNVGDIVLAKVTGISDFGFFVSIGNFKGLCHISEISKYVRLDKIDWIIEGH